MSHCFVTHATNSDCIVYDTIKLYLELFEEITNSLIRTTLERSSVGASTILEHLIDVRSIIYCPPDRLSVE